MSALQVRRGLSTQRSGFAPLEGELIYTTDTKEVYIGDGITPGGNPVGGGIGVSGYDFGWYQDGPLIPSSPWSFLLTATVVDFGVINVQGAGYLSLDLGTF